LFSFFILHVTFVPIKQLTDEAKVVERLFLTRTHCGRIASLILMQQQRQQIKLNVVGLSSPFFIEENILSWCKKKKNIDFRNNSNIEKGYF
jgi:hypothetical protein